MGLEVSQVATQLTKAAERPCLIHVFFLVVSYLSCPTLTKSLISVETTAGQGLTDRSVVLVGRGAFDRNNNLFLVVEGG